MSLSIRTLQWLQVIALIGAIAAILLVLTAGPGTRFGLWHFRTAFTLMRWGAYAGIGAGALAIVTAGLRVHQRRGVFWCATALVLGGLGFWFPWHQLQVAKGVPPIHDISTDTDHPPVFVALLAARGVDANPVVSDPEVAAQQHQAYPDIAPLTLAEPMAPARSRALAAVQKMGWALAASEGDDRIEATATTAWFGFKDDVVIRLTAVDADHTRIDVRSVSRVGRSDLGANAARIRKYLAAVNG